MQNINLYQPEDAGRVLLFSSASMVLALAAVLIVMGLLSAFGAYSAGRAEARLAEAEQRREQAVKALENLEKAPGSPQEEASLREAITRLEGEREDRRVALEGVTGLSMDIEGGLAEPLAALSRQHRPQLWLTDIRIGRQGLRLQGSTNDQQQIADYLERLSKEPVFRGTRFRSMRVERMEPGAGGRFHFELSSEAAP